MRLLSLFAFLIALVLVVAPSGRSQGGAKPIQIYIVVPADYQSTATPEQADSAVRIWLGQPTDPPCIGSQYTCTIEGWFRHELGQVFEYQVTTIPLPALNSGTDACGSWFGFGPFQWVEFYLKQLHYSTSGRTIILLMGGGGWAGHFSPADKLQYGQPNAIGMVGDWGVEQQYGVPVSCIPAPDAPAHGFSHEFAGMMGEYVTAGYNEGGLFLGDVMSANEKADLLHYSGGWLRNP